MSEQIIDEATAGLEGLTVLGRTVQAPLDHLESFPAPDGCTQVTFETSELASICPVTAQPDLSTLTIDYGPNQRCIESKSLKLHLWSYRDRPIFAEALAVAIADEVARAVDPHWLHVTVRQQARGGIVTTTQASRGTPPAR